MIKKLKDVSNKAIAKYSNFHVASIFVKEDLSEFFGFNIENSSYPLSICAERVALFTAINNGIDVSDVKEIHIYSKDANEIISPCGACRQVISDLVPGNPKIFMYDKNGSFDIIMFNDLFPYRIKEKNIKGLN